MSTFQALGIPFSEATVDLTAFGITQLPTQAPAAFFIQPVLPGRENIFPTSYSFLVEHPTSQKKILFDLGPRKDLEHLSPASYSLVSPDSPGAIIWNITKDVTELLHEAETPLDAINSVIWSHTHFDHVGDMSKFPSSTELIIGPGTVRDVYDPNTNPNGTLLASDFANRTVTELSFDNAGLKIGGFPALDHFGDGSFFLLNVPGHQVGHIAGLARVTVDPTTFILLAADSFHHVGQIRPTEALHKAVLISEELLASAQEHVSTQYFRSGGNDTKGFDFKARTGPFFDVVETGFYADPSTSRTSQLKVQAFDANDDVFVLATHDTTLNNLIGQKNSELNRWKELNFKEEVLWQFVNTSDYSWRLSPA